MFGELLLFIANIISTIVIVESKSIRHLAFMQSRIGECHNNDWHDIGYAMQYFWAQLFKTNDVVS